MDTSLITLVKKIAPEDAETLITSLGDTVLRSIRVALMEALPEEHVDAFEEILKKGERIIWHVNGVSKKKSMRLRLLISFILRILRIMAL